METILDRAMSDAPDTRGVLILSERWVPIAARGDLAADDAPALTRLISWMEQNSTGTVTWRGGLIQFHRAPTHTLVLYRAGGYKRPNGYPRYQ